MNLSEPSNFTPFNYRNGRLFCERLEMESLLGEIPEEVYGSVKGLGSSVSYGVPSTPVFVYSTEGMQQTVKGYLSALCSAKLKGKVGYAIKANPNIHLIEKLKSFGVEMAITVSGYEVLAALRAGFSPENILLNGNGKQDWEVKLGIEQGVMMNIDSSFDAERIARIHGDLESEREVQVLLRIRPVKETNGANLQVHDYVNTADNSKFGFEFSELDNILDILSSREQIKVVGVHCHFGSCIADPKVYEWLGKTIAEIVNELQRKNVPLKFLNVGGGIGIDYFKPPPGFKEAVTSQNYEVVASNKILREGTSVAEFSEFFKALSLTLPKDIDVILEPGRSLVGKAGVLLCKVLGKKTSNERRQLVVDGSMNEVIRPCLYGAYHQILPTNVNSVETWETYDVVGPICESADFLGKNIPMQGSAKYVAVMDCGAYCSSMSSNYNLKPRAAEILVNAEKWTYIRKRDTFQEIIDKCNPN